MLLKIISPKVQNHVNKVHVHIQSQNVYQDEKKQAL